MDIKSAVVTDTYMLRRLSANAVRFRLGAQLDWRLDLMLDSEGLHLLFLRGLYVIKENRAVEWLLHPDNRAGGGNLDFEQQGEFVTRTEGYLKLARTREPLTVPLDLRMRDYARLAPAPNRSDLGEAVRYSGSTVLGALRPDENTPRYDEASERLHQSVRDFGVN